MIQLNHRAYIRNVINCRRLSLYIRFAFSIILTVLHVSHGKRRRLFHVGSYLIIAKKGEICCLLIHLLLPSYLLRRLAVLVTSFVCVAGGWCWNSDTALGKWLWKMGLTAGFRWACECSPSTMIQLACWCWVICFASVITEVLDSSMCKMFFFFFVLNLLLWFLILVCSCKWTVFSSSSVIVKWCFECLLGRLWYYFLMCLVSWCFFSIHFYFVCCFFKKSMKRVIKLVVVNSSSHQRAFS